MAESQNPQDRSSAFLIDRLTDGRDSRDSRASDRIWQAATLPQAAETAPSVSVAPLGLLIPLV
jgi:hypothetical protein